MDMGDYKPDIDMTNDILDEMIRDEEMSEEAAITIRHAIQAYDRRSEFKPVPEN